MYVSHKKEEIVIHARRKQQSASANRPCNGLARLFGFVCMGTNSRQRHGQLGAIPTASKASPRRCTHSSPRTRFRTHFSPKNCYTSPRDFSCAHRQRGVHHE